MDQHHHHPVAKRAASHGALSSAYAGDDGPPDFDPSMFRRPPRSVKENMAFLQSPGPVRSMLKTTTETGDIGIFSTTKVPAPRPRPRPRPQDPRLARQTLSRASDRSLPRDGRFRPPSHRDSASEIISMYGSDSHRSTSTHPSPPVDDAAYRAYSMASHGPRNTHSSQSYRSDGYAQGPPAPSGLQRPRSPYPYPTRLKRPGVRPSSPALTESGNVDYSRMVEIDRVSSRTVHGSYKPTYPPPHARRPLPLSLRSAANYSRPALSGYLEEPRSRPPLLGPSYRPHPSDYPAWDARFQSGPARTVESPDPSGRTSSSPASGASGNPADGTPFSGRGLTPKRSFYYDYSEEFEDTHDEQAVPPVPLRLPPPPPHASSTDRPMVPEDDGDDRLVGTREDGGRGPVDFLERRAVSDSPRHCGPTFGGEQPTSAGGGPDDEIPRQRNATHPGVPLPHRECQVIQRRAGAVPSMITVGPESPGSTTSPDVTRGKASMESNDTLRTLGIRTVPQSPETNVAPSASELTSPVADGDSPTAQGREHAAESCLGAEANPTASGPAMGAEEVAVGGARMGPQQPAATASAPEDASDAQKTLGAAPPQAPADQSRASRLYSLDPALNDLASFVRRVDDAIEGPGILDTDEPRKPLGRDVARCHTTPPYTVVSSESGSSEMDRVVRERQSPKPPVPEPLAYRHRRNPAALKIDTGAVPGSGGESHHGAPARTETPMLAPQPLSPARELRVKNSIPQLMKALPPLPAYPPTPESPGAAAVPANLNNFDLSRLTEAHSTLIDEMEHGNAGDDIAKRQYHHANAFRGQGRIAKPRLKLRQGFQNRRGEYDYPEQHDGYAPSRKRPRFMPSTDEPSGPWPLERLGPGLKVKGSRGALSTKSCDETGTIKRHAILEKSSTVSALALKDQEDLLAPFLSHGPASKQGQGGAASSSRPQQATETKDDSVLDSPSTPMAQDPGPSNKRGSSLDAQLDSMRLPSAPPGPVTPGVQSFFSQGSDLIPRDLVPQRGLKKRLSDLRARLAETRPPQAEFPVLNVYFSEDAEEKAAPAASTTPVPLPREANGGKPGSKPKEGMGQTRSAEKGKLKRKISRWVKDATQAVRAYVKKKPRA